MNLYLNGTYYKTPALKEYSQSLIADSSAAPWEKELAAFLTEWFDDRAFIIAKTSGSTGTPKAIKLYKKHMINSARMTGQYFGLKEGDRALLCLSPRYIAGKMMLVRALVLGLQLTAIETSGNPLQALQEPVDFAAMVPLQLYNALEYRASLPKAEDPMKKLKQLIVGGGVVSGALQARLGALPTKIYATYGMTETVSHVAVKKLNGTGVDDTYRALPGITFSKDERACLRIKAPGLCTEMQVTNDLVALLDETRFRWLGRYDNMINSGGLKIIPEQVEKKLRKSIPERFFVTGMKDEKLGEKVVLLIEGEERPLRFDQVSDPYEKPVAVFFVPRFEETETGKLRRDLGLYNVD